MTKVRGAVAVFSLLCTVGLLGMAGGAWGQLVSTPPAHEDEDQGVVPSTTPRTFGTASEVVHVVGAWEFNATSGEATFADFGNRACQPLSNSGCSMLANVRLPAGAVVSRITLDACDPRGDDQVAFSMRRTPSPATSSSLANLTGNVGTGIGATPGCAIFPAPLLAPETIDNEHFTYTLRVSIGGDSGETSFTAVRVYYTLQVAPPPATATFGDVPTSHPFFQFVEALVASGITSGCQASPPLYCLDQAVTRGQMAVFLSTALGLHFAP
jgi:hypothetical protein